MRPLLLSMVALLAVMCPDFADAQRPDGPSAQSVAKAIFAKDKEKCCDAIIEAAKEARDAGDITAKEYRRMRLFRMLFPRRFHALAEAALEQYIEEAPVIAADGTINEIDWDALLEFLRELMPLILEFIEALMNIFEPLSLAPALDTSYVSAIPPPAFHLAA